MYDVSTHALSAVGAAVASFKPMRLDPPCKDAHDHVTCRYEGALSWAAVVSERGRMTASITESRRHSSPECGEQRPSENNVRIIFPNFRGLFPTAQALLVGSIWPLIGMSGVRESCKFFGRCICGRVRGASRPLFRVVGAGQMQGTLPFSRPRGAQSF